VSRSIDDIEAVIFPETSGRGGLDGDAALLFLVHEVGSGRAVVNFAQFMNFSGKFKNTLGSGGFTGIHVGENTNVSVKG
jgi:hypothetical protein